MKTRARKAVRRFLLFLITPVLLLTVAYTGLEMYTRRDYRPNFIEQKGRLTSVREKVLERTAKYSLIEFRLENDKGTKVDGLIKVPPPAMEAHPAILMLGGLGTGRRVVDYIEGTEGVVLLALDYPYEGKKSKLGRWEFVKNIPDMRRAVIHTVPAVMLAVDYLLGREGVDAERITLVGGSLGAFFCPAVAAADRRISAVAILFGAGRLESLIYANLVRSKPELPKPVSRLASWICSVLTSPVEPLKYIGGIAPRPVFLLNGTEDPRIPERSSRLLHERAGHPKTVRWIPAGHVHVRDEEFRDLVARELMTWLLERKLIPPHAAGDYLGGS